MPTVIIRSFLPTFNSALLATISSELSSAPCSPPITASCLSSLLAHLLSSFCRYGGFSTLLTAESATHAASSVISAITKGQGRIAAVHSRMQRWLLGVHHAYPLHDSSHTHIAYCFHYQRLSTLSSLAAIEINAHSRPQAQTRNTALKSHSSSSSSSSPSSSSPQSPSPSPLATLDTLSRSLIASLDSLFGHSVANVLRTVEKVDRPDVAATADCCCWCGEELPPTQQFGGCIVHTVVLNAAG